MKAEFKKEQQDVQKHHLIGPDDTDSMESFIALKRLSWMIAHYDEILRDQEMLKRE